MTRKIETAGGSIKSVPEIEIPTILHDFLFRQNGCYPGESVIEIRNERRIAALREARNLFREYKGKLYQDNLIFSLIYGTLVFNTHADNNHLFSQPNGTFTPKEWRVAKEQGWISKSLPSDMWIDNSPENINI